VKYSLAIVVPSQELQKIASSASEQIAKSTRNSLLFGGLLVVVLLVFSFLAALTIGNRLMMPLRTLTSTAEEITRGNLNAEASVQGRDEIGLLATTFNSMTSQLRDLIGSLEKRVADRTKALATTTEVSRRLSTILEKKEMVDEVVNQVNNAFGYYHTQIYFYDEANEYLVMAGGTGEAGKMMLAQFHKVAKGRGLVGRAAGSNEAVLVSDTSQNPEWLPNPLLPDTESEMAIPISVGDQVLGVLDVQHNIKDGLKREDVDSLQSIANQVAVALQNIQSTETVIKRAAELQTVARISTAAATISDIQKMLETVVHLTQRGFGLYHAHVFIYNENTADLAITACGYQEGDIHEGTHGTAIIPLAQEQSLVARAARTRQPVIVNNVRNEPGWLPNPLLPDTASELAVPLIVGDQLLGVLDVQSDHLNFFSQEDANIQSTLASQVAVALQNARSFNQAQKQAERETAVNLITQKIQNTTSIESALQIAARELGHALGMKSTLVTLEPEELAGKHENTRTTEPMETGVSQ
jgi:GAF domain-containing protein/HAMP domain-containing protein